MTESIQILNSSVRLPLLIFAVIAFSLTIDLRDDGFKSARNNLGIVSSLFTLLFSIIGAWVSLLVDRLCNAPIILAVDFVDFVLLLSASASMTAQRGVCHAHNNCPEYRAATAFLYLAWVFLFFIMFIDGYMLTNGGGVSNLNMMRKKSRSKPATPAFNNPTTTGGAYVDDRAADPENQVDSAHQNANAQEPIEAGKSKSNNAN